MCCWVSCAQKCCATASEGIFKPSHAALQDPQQLLCCFQPVSCPRANASCGLKDSRTHTKYVSSSCCCCWQSTVVLHRVIPLPGFDPATRCTNPPANFFPVPRDEGRFESYESYGRKPDWFMSKTYDVYQAALTGAAAGTGTAAAASSSAAATRASVQPGTKGKAPAGTFRVSARSSGSSELGSASGTRHILTTATAASMEWHAQWPTAAHLDISESGMGTFRKQPVAAVELGHDSNVSVVIRVVRQTTRSSNPPSSKCAKAQ